MMIVVENYIEEYPLIGQQQITAGAWCHTTEWRREAVRLFFQLYGFDVVTLDDTQIYLGLENGLVKNTNIRIDQLILAIKYYKHCNLSKIEERKI